MELNDNRLNRLADLAKLELTEGERANLPRELGAILGYMGALREVEPVKSRRSVRPCPLRLDEPTPSLPRDELLRAAPRADGGLFLVPRTLE